MILSLMNKLGYKISEKGMCYGIAYMAVQSFLSGEGTKFINRMLKLKKGKFNRTIRSLLLKRKRITKEHKLSSREIELRAFFDGISLYHGLGIQGSSYPNLQKWKREFHFFNNDNLANSLTISDLIIHSGIVLQDITKLKKLVSWALAQNGPLAIPLSDDIHQVTLVKSTQGSLYLVDHDDVTKIESERNANIIAKAIGQKSLIFAEIITKKYNPPLLSGLKEVVYRTKNDFISLKEKLNGESTLSVSLYFAVRGGYEKLVLSILKASSSEESILNSNIDEKNVKPLLLASQRGHLSLVKLLIKHGSNINALSDANTTALHGAAMQGNSKVINYLLLKGAAIDLRDRFGMTPLLHASNNGHIEAVILLLKKGANINALDESNRNALLLACENGHLEVVKTLLKSNIHLDQIDKYGLKAIFVALLRGHLKTVEALLSKSSIDQVLNDEDEATLLFAAASFGDLSSVKFLVSKGAAIDQADAYGTTPLAAFSKEGNLSIVEFLASKGANINEVDNDEESPLYLASEAGHINIVNYLLAKQADYSRRNEDGISPLMVAAQMRHPVIVRNLIKAGATITADEIAAVMKSDLWTDEKKHRGILKLLRGKTTNRIKDSKALKNIKSQLKKLNNQLSTLKARKLSTSKRRKKRVLEEKIKKLELRKSKLQ